MVRQLCLLIAFTFLFIVSKAEKISQASEPTWLYKTSPNYSKKPESKDISNGYYLELLDRQVNIETSAEYLHIVRHIVNESGVQNASEVSVSFNPNINK